MTTTDDALLLEIETALGRGDSVFPRDDVRFLLDRLKAAESRIRELEGALRHANTAMEHAGIDTCVECDHTGRCSLPCAGGHVRAVLAGIRSDDVQEEGNGG